jgi:hypothetical protein
VVEVVLETRRPTHTTLAFVSVSAMLPDIVTTHIDQLPTSLSKAGHISSRTTSVTDYDTFCTFLKKNGRCSVHVHRPLRQGAGIPPRGGNVGRLASPTLAIAKTS